MEKKVIPAASYELFGNVTHGFKLEQFKSRGHIPIFVEISDLNLMAALSDNDSRGLHVAVPNQCNRRGSAIYVGFRTSISNKSAGRTYHYASIEDSNRINSLYEDLREAYDEAALNLPAFLSEDQKTQIFNFYANRIANGTAFRVKSMKTISIVTRKVCYWKTGFYDVMTCEGLKQERRMKLETVSSIGSERIEKDDLFLAADGMFEDQCEVSLKEEPVCSSKHERYEKKNKDNIKHIFD